MTTSSLTAILKKEYRKRRSVLPKPKSPDVIQEIAEKYNLSKTYTRRLIHTKQV